MWFLHDLGRLNQERTAVAALEAASDWLDGVHWQLDADGIRFDADIVLNEDDRFAIRLLFPEHYPSVPPSVRPQHPEQWSSHQYATTGDLCLELGPDNWHPDAHDASHMVQSAYRLLTLEADSADDPTVEIPSRHELTEGQKHRHKMLRWVLTPAARAVLAALPADTALRCEFYAMHHEQTLTVFLYRIEYPEAEDWTDPNVPPDLKRLGRATSGVVLTKQLGALKRATLTQPGALVALLEKQSFPAPKNTDAGAESPHIEFVVVPDLGSGWLALWNWHSEDKASECSTVEADTAPVSQRLGADVQALEQVGVAVVGLGSAGSKIATSLARSGVGRFVLLDDDLLHPANLVRHDSDWFEVGQHKVDAVADRLKLVNPKVEIIRRKHRLSGQESSTSAASALAALGRADLIIDATANATVFSLCAHVARYSKKALIWLEIYAGGIGGQVARARPDKDAEPFTLREAINAAATELAEKKGVEPPTPAEDYSAMDGEDVLIASDADVATIASIATQIALDTLLNREPSHYPYPAYLVGLSRGWVFDQPLHTIPIECTAPVDWSNVVKTDKATREEAAAFVIQLLEAQTDDADTESTD